MKKEALTYTKKYLPSKNIILIGLVSLFNDISSEMILPILPLLIAHLGGSGIAIGLIGGLRGSGADLLKVLFGHWSDKLKKRRTFMYAGYITSVLSKLALLVAKSWHTVFMFVGCDRIGKAMRSAPRDALITHAMPGQIGKAFGIHRAFDNLGAILGSLTTFMLMWYWNPSLSHIIFIASIIGFFSLIPIIFITEQSIKDESTTVQDNTAPFSHTFIRFTLVASIFSLANMSYMFLILHAQKTINHSTPLYVSMLLYVFFNIFYTLFAIPFGSLSDRIGRWKVLLFGYSIFSATTFGFYYATTPVFFALCFMSYGIALAAINVNHKAYAADLAAHHLTATSLGFFETSTGLTMLLSGVLTGIIWETIGHGYVFCYAGLIAAGACILLGVSKK